MKLLECFISDENYCCLHTTLIEAKAMLKSLPNMFQLIKLTGLGYAFRIFQEEFQMS